MEKIVILGGGGHALSVVDSIIRMNAFQPIGYTDPGEDTVVLGERIEYLGTDDILKNLFESGVRYAAVGVGFLGEHEIRDRLFHMATSIGFRFPEIIDPSAVVSEWAKLGEGTFVGKNAVINAGASVGRMCIINTGAIVDHNCQIGIFSHISVGVNVCGDVTIGDHSFVGAGTTIIQGIRIGRNAVIGAGSLVIRDVKNGVRTFGLVK